MFVLAAVVVGLVVFVGACGFVDQMPGARELVQRTLLARRDGRLPRRFTRDHWADVCSAESDSTRHHHSLRYRVTECFSTLCALGVQ